jgi:hypothetical protein
MWPAGTPPSACRAAPAWGNAPPAVPDGRFEHRLGGHHARRKVAPLDAAVRQRAERMAAVVVLHRLAPVVGEGHARAGLVQRREAELAHHLLAHRGLMAGSSDTPGSTTVRLSTRAGSCEASSRARLPPVAAPTRCTGPSSSASKQGAQVVQVVVVAVALGRVVRQAVAARVGRQEAVGQAAVLHHEVPHACVGAVGVQQHHRRARARPVQQVQAQRFAVTRSDCAGRRHA